MTPATDEIADELEEQAKLSVQSRTSPDGRSWPARSPATVRRHGQRSSGRLARSIEGRSTEQGVTVGASVPYAAAVQYGTRTMAARPYLPTQGSADGLLTRIARKLLSYVSRGE